MIHQIESALEDLRSILDKASVTRATISIVDRGCPHEPEPLPSGMMAVYIFIYNDEILKIGKVGSQSNARFVYQHYIPKSSKSNLAKSLLSDSQSPISPDGIDDQSIGAWMKSKLQRIDILVEKSAGMPVLTLLEAFLQCRFSPRYEGRQN
jgi:hypothetical protein